MYAAENCIVVAEGALQHSGVFAVAALGFPPAELRAESQVAAKARCPPFYPGPSTCADCAGTCMTMHPSHE
jgi:hypothetical protein